MLKFKKGDLVQIIDSSHSGPVQAMDDLIGGVYPVDQVYSENNYIVKGYAWARQDLAAPPHKPADKSAKSFKIKNLVDINNLFD